MCSPKISFLAYPDFETDRHPALTEAVVVDLVTGKTRRDDYRGRANPPILHRRETFPFASSPPWLWRPRRGCGIPAVAVTSPPWLWHLRRGCGVPAVAVASPPWLWRPSRSCGITAVAVASQP
jgi:hypothetical protein